MLRHGTRIYSYVQAAIHSSVVREKASSAYIAAAAAATAAATAAAPIRYQFTRTITYLSLNGP